MNKKDPQILKMLTESVPEVELISEAYDPSMPRTLKFRGIFLVSDKKNGNNRIYPYEELKPEVDRFREEMINTNRALMELEHPASSEIDPSRASARILSLEEDNHQWIGEAVILCSDKKHGISGTPCGDVLASLTMYGTKWGVSSRAMGQVDPDSGIVSDLHLVTIDTVMNPSIGEMVATDGNRFVNGILESKGWICDNHGILIEQSYNKLEKTLSKMPNTNITTKKNAHIINSLTDFFGEIAQS